MMCDVTSQLSPVSTKLHAQALGRMIYYVISQLSPLATKQRAQALGRTKLPTRSSRANTHRCIYLSTSAYYSDDAEEERVAAPNLNQSLCMPIKLQGGLHGEAHCTEQIHLRNRDSGHAKEMRIQLTPPLLVSYRERIPTVTNADH